MAASLMGPPPRAPHHHQQQQQQLSEGRAPPLRLDEHPCAGSAETDSSGTTTTAKATTNGEATAGTSSSDVALKLQSPDEAVTGHFSSVSGQAAKGLSGMRSKTED